MNKLASTFITISVIALLTVNPASYAPYNVFIPAVYTVPVDRVALLADTQNEGFNYQQETISTLAVRNNRFLVMAGDVVGLGGCTDMQCADERYIEQLETLRPLADLEWHFSPGNHEYKAGVEIGIEAWEKWVGPRYHVFNTTHACFFMIDDQVWDDEQAQWLDASIMQCNKPWRILVKHFPMPHSVEHHHDPDFERYADLDVDLILAGHRHSFIVWQTGQTLNIVLPTAGKLSPGDPYPVAADEVVTPFPVACSGFGELVINPESLAWQIFRWDGLLLLEGEGTTTLRSDR